MKHSVREILLHYPCITKAANNEQRDNIINEPLLMWLNVLVEMLNRPHIASINIDKSPGGS